MHLITNCNCLESAPSAQGHCHKNQARMQGQVPNQVEWIGNSQIGHLLLRTHLDWAQDSRASPHCFIVFNNRRMLTDTSAYQNLGCLSSGPWVAPRLSGELNAHTWKALPGLSEMKPRFPRGQSNLQKESI